MNIHRYAAAIVDDSDGIVCVDRDGDFGAVAGKSFIYGVIDHLEDHVVQSGAVISITDIHSGSFAHCIETLENFDIGRIVRHSPASQKKYHYILKKDCF